MAALTRKKIITIASFALVLISFLIFKPVACERIDAGHEGIKVDLYGSKKGVNDVSLATGKVFYNPYYEQVFEYPIYVQTYDYAPFTVNSKDGSVFTIDPTLSLGILEGSTPKIFKKYRKDVIEIVKTTFYNHIRDVYRIEFNVYTTDEIIGNREKLESAVQAKMEKLFFKEGFYLDQLTHGIKPPQSIVDAINAKNKAVQDAQRVENELRVVEADAKKLVVQAQAEAEANRLKQITLTPLLIQQQAIERWDGKLPSTVAGGQIPFVKTLN